MVSIQLKISRHVKKQENVTHNCEKRFLIEIGVEMLEIMEWTDMEVINAIINKLKDLKQMINLGDRT